MKLFLLTLLACLVRCSQVVEESPLSNSYHSENETLLDASVVALQSSLEQNASPATTEPSPIKNLDLIETKRRPLLKSLRNENAAELEKDSLKFEAVEKVLSNSKSILDHVLAMDFPIENVEKVKEYSTMVAEYYNSLQELRILFEDTRLHCYVAFDLAVDIIIKLDPTFDTSWNSIKSSCDERFKNFSVKLKKASLVDKLNFLEREYNSLYKRAYDAFINDSEFSVIECLDLFAVIHERTHWHRVIISGKAEKHERIVKALEKLKFMESNGKKFCLLQFGMAVFLNTFCGERRSIRDKCNSCDAAIILAKKHMAGKKALNVENKMNFESTLADLTNSKAAASKNFKSIRIIEYVSRFEVRRMKRIELISSALNVAVKRNSSTCTLSNEEQSEKVISLHSKPKPRLQAFVELNEHLNGINLLEKDSFRLQHVEEMLQKTKEKRVENDSPIVIKESLKSLLMLRNLFSIKSNFHFILFDIAVDFMRQLNESESWPSLTAACKENKESICSEMIHLSRLESLDFLESKVNSYLQLAFDSFIDDEQLTKNDCLNIIAVIQITSSLYTRIVREMREKYTLLKATLEQLNWAVDGPKTFHASIIGSQREIDSLKNSRTRIRTDCNSFDKVVDLANRIMKGEQVVSKESSVKLKSALEKLRKKTVVQLKGNEKASFRMVTFASRYEQRVDRSIKTIERALSKEGNCEKMGEGDSNEIQQRNSNEIGDGNLIEIGEINSIESGERYLKEIQEINSKVIREGNLKDNEILDGGEEKEANMIDITEEDELAVSILAQMKAIKSWSD